MSYGLIVRKDNRYSGVSTRDAVRAELIRHPELILGNDGHGAYTGRSFHFVISPYFASPEGDMVDPPANDPQRINVVAVTLTWLNDHEEEDETPFIDIAEDVARVLGWRVYDPQEGKYTDGGPNDPPAAKPRAKKRVAKKPTAKKSAKKGSGSKAGAKRK